MILNKQEKIIGIFLLLSLIVCVGLTSSQAICVQTLANESITCGDNTNCEFRIGEELKNISIIFKSQEDLGNNVLVRVLLCKDLDCSGSKRLTQKDIQASKFNDNYIATLCSVSSNCLDISKLTSSGDYYIKSYIDPNDLNIKVERKIYIKKTLEVELNCPLSGVINREISCDFGVEDIDNQGVPLSTYTAEAIVTQGDTVIPSIIVLGARGTITFTTQNIGNVDVKLIVDKTDYLTTEETAYIDVQHPTNTNTLLIDNKNLIDYSGSGIEKGIRQIQIKVEKSGTPLELNSVVADMINPSGLKTTLTFTRVNDNTFKTTYNFEEEGKTYTLRGQAIPEDVGESPMNLEYGILVAGAVTQDSRSSIAWILGGSIGGVVVFVIIIVVIILIVRKGRKKR